MKRRATHKLMEWQRQAILGAYLAREKIEAICEEFGISRRYPALLAKRSGLKRRAVGRPRSSPTAKTAQHRKAVLPDNWRIERGSLFACSLSRAVTG